MSNLVAQTLQEVYELLKDESHWTQDASARDSKGRPCSSVAPQACQWCLMGAISKVGNPTSNDFYENDAQRYYTEIYLAELLHSKHSYPHGTVTGFNDNSSHLEVLKLLQTAMDNLTKK